MSRYTSVGYGRAVQLLEDALEADALFHAAYPALGLTHGLLALEQRDLGLDNTREWVLARFYADAAIMRQPGPEADKATAVVISSREFLTPREYGEAYRDEQDAWDDPSSVIRALKDIFDSHATDHSREALAYIDEALAAAPDDAETLVLRWIIGNRGAEQSEEYRRAVQIDPRNVLAAYEIAAAKLRAGQTAEAQVALREVLRLNPDHPRAMADLGHIAMGLGLEKESTDLLRHALALDPDLPDAHYDLGKILAVVREPAPAIAEYEAAAKLKPDWGEPLYEEAALLAEGGEWQRAVDVLETLVPLSDNREYDARCLLTECHLNMERLDQAEQEAGRAVLVNPDGYAGWYLAGLVALQCGDPRMAIKKCTKALELNPISGNAHFLIGQAQLTLGKNRQAADELRSAESCFLAADGVLDDQMAEETARGHLRGVERLLRLRRDLAARIAECETILAQLAPPSK